MLRPSFRHVIGNNQTDQDCPKKSKIKLSIFFPPNILWICHRIDDMILPPRTGQVN
jgi:hypothetical protein